MLNVENTVTKKTTVSTTITAGMYQFLTINSINFEYTFGFELLLNLGVGRRELAIADTAIHPAKNKIAPIMPIPLTN